MLKDNYQRLECKIYLNFQMTLAIKIQNYKFLKINFRTETFQSHKVLNCKIVMIYFRPQIVLNIIPLKMWSGQVKITFNLWNPAK